MLKIIRNKLGILPWLGVRALSWHVQHALGKTPSPLACGIYLTNQCNLRCEFCNIWRKKAKATIDRDKALTLVRELGELGCFYLSFVGGEPLLVPYLFDAIRAAKTSDIHYTHVVTNGQTLTKEVATEFSSTGLDEISISIDGPEQVHDSKRGRLGAYQKAVAAISHLQQHAPEIKIVLNTILSFTAPQDCLHAVALAKERGIHVKIQPYNCHPAFETEGDIATDERQISEEKLQQARETVQTLLHSPQVVNSQAFLQATPKYLETGRGTLFKDRPCLFGYHHLEVAETGQVFPCLEGMEWKNGYNGAGRLRELLGSGEYRKAVYDLKHCKGCERTMYICYYEPRISFPIWNLIRPAK